MVDETASPSALPLRKSLLPTSNASARSDARPTGARRQPSDSLTDLWILVGVSEAARADAEAGASSSRQ